MPIPRYAQISAGEKLDVHVVSPGGLHGTCRSESHQIHHGENARDVVSHIHPMAL